MEEIFVPVIGFEKYYRISNFGNVYSEHKKRLLKPKLTKAGYYRIVLCGDRRKEQRSIHRMVAEAFVPNEQNKPTVNHKNEIKTDNRAENLEWATIAEQNAYGTRMKRALEHTDWKKRTMGMDYKKIAMNHNYQADNMCSRKRVLVYKNDFLIGEYRSLREAATKLGINYSKASMCANGQRKRCGGYTLKYKEEE